ncbi:hypothetical protein BT93_G1487 [Corymbia citriodora subsp. variegata]|nr:hypothetical protein BT93_G1487 [Corymbia citriodora subsp. variegata]
MTKISKVFIFFYILMEKEVLCPNSKRMRCIFFVLYTVETAPYILHALSKIIHIHGTTDTTKQLKNLISLFVLDKPIRGASYNGNTCNHSNKYIAMITSSR